MLKKTGSVFLITLLLTTGSLYFFHSKRDYLVQKIDRPYLEEVPFLGVRGVENGITQAKYFYNNKLIREVSYKMKDHFRETLNDTSETENQVVFFGGSYIFGYGLNQNETLPELFRKKHSGNINIQNLGIPSWGIHQFLHLLEEGALDHSFNKKSSVIYGHIRNHQLRTSHHPLLLISNPIMLDTISYHLQNRQLIKLGPYKNHFPIFSKLLAFLSSFSFARKISSQLTNTFFHFGEEQRIELFCSLLKKVDLELTRRKINFFVFSYDDPKSIEKCELTRAKFIRFPKELQDFSRNNPARIHQSDSHPSKLFNEKIAGYLLKILDQGENR